MLTTLMHHMEERSTNTTVEQPRGGMRALLRVTTTTLSCPLALTGNSTSVDCCAVHKKNSEQDFS